MCSSLLASVVGVLELQTEAYSSLALTKVKFHGQFSEGKEN
jgi:hypothetical protein